MHLFSFKSHTKQRLKGFFLIFIVLVTYLCIAAVSGYLPFKKQPAEDRSFSAFTSALFREEAASNTLNLHFTLQDPTQYGITDTPITFGSFSSNVDASKVAIENCQASLETFSYNALSEKNKLTYDILTSYLQTAETGTSYLLHEEPLSPITGIQAQLPVLLAEYRFEKASDIETYLTLLETTPDYFASLIDFEKEKAERGLFLPDPIVDTVIEQCSSLLNVGDTHYLYTTFEERVSSVKDLTTEEQASYIRRNEKAVQTFFLPAYQSFIFALKELKGSGGDLSGICRLHDGKKYYEYLVQKETGSSRSISELKKLIHKQMQADIASLGVLLKTSAPPKLSLTESPDQILKNLEHKITPAFPQPADVLTEVKYVPKSMEPYLSPAFYLIPCIDDTSENTIYINRAHNMDDLKLFTTLAHEGYPGHLYQTTYFAAKNPDPIRTLLNFGGYTEGWATYAEMCSYYLAPLPKKDASLAQKNSSLILGLYALADIGVHYDGWTVPDTIKFFSNYGIDDADTIQEIYELIVSDPANYLKYYVGYVELLELKKEVANRLGDNFSQKEFHKAVLDVGPAPFEIVRKYVLSSFHLH